MGFTRYDGSDAGSQDEMSPAPHPRHMWSGAGAGAGAGAGGTPGSQSPGSPGQWATDGNQYVVAKVVGFATC